MSLTYNPRPQVAVLSFVIGGQHSAVFVDGLVDWLCGCGAILPDGDAALRAHETECVRKTQWMRA